MRYFKKNTFFINLKHISIILLLLFLFVFICANSYTNSICSNISNSVFRLHVIANSNTQADQDLKYKVRDEIINYMNTIINNNMSKKEVIKIASENINKIQEIANNSIKSSGYNYNVTVSIDNILFPTKYYGNISLPCGYYDALQIKIGEASGKNWWCVIFPALCFVDVSSGSLPKESEELLESTLNEESYNLISEQTSSMKFKFKIVEVLQNINNSAIFM